MRVPFVAVAGTISVALASACARTEAGAIRHVVLISLDTTRADHLGCYGATSARTPNLDRLAGEGVVFEDATTPAPTTLAAHTSIMTGTYPQTHGVVRNGFVVDPANVMLAELLADRGFATAAVLGSFALDRRFGFAQGFRDFDEDFDVLAFGDGRAGHDQNQRRADRVTDAALAAVDRADADRLFLFVHYFDPHQPYDPPPPFDSGGGPEGPATAADVASAVARHAQEILGSPRTPADLINGGLDARLVEEAKGVPLPGDERLAALYAGEVSFVDREVGRLLAGLADRDVLEHALVVVVGDHGETFWEHGDSWNHGLWVYDTTVRVPFVLRFPARADGSRRGEGVRVAAPVSTIDLLPTLCELLGIDPSERVEGSSLVPAIDGGPVPERPIFSQATQPGSRVEPSNAPWKNVLKPRCVREGRWKYVQAPYLAPGATTTGAALGDPGLEQLFDLEADPGEQRNLLRGELDPGTAAALDRLRAALDAWWRSARPLPSRFDDSQLEEVQERLRNMGYTGK